LPKRQKLDISGSKQLEQNLPRKLHLTKYVMNQQGLAKFEVEWKQSLNKKPIKSLTKKIRSKRYKRVLLIKQAKDLAKISKNKSYNLEWRE